MLTIGAVMKALASNSDTVAAPNTKAAASRRVTDSPRILQLPHTVFNLFLNDGQQTTCSIVCLMSSHAQNGNTSSMSIVIEAQSHVPRKKIGSSKQ